MTGLIDTIWLMGWPEQNKQTNTHTHTHTYAFRKIGTGQHEVGVGKPMEAHFNLLPRLFLVCSRRSLVDKTKTLKCILSPRPGSAHHPLAILGVHSSIESPCEPGLRTHACLRGILHLGCVALVPCEVVAELPHHGAHLGDALPEGARQPVGLIPSHLRRRVPQHLLLRIGCQHGDLHLALPRGHPAERHVILAHVHHHLQHCVPTSPILAVPLWPRAVAHHVIAIIPHHELDAHLHHPGGCFRAHVLHPLLVLQRHVPPSAPLPQIVMISLVQPILVKDSNPHPCCSLPTAVLCASSSDAPPTPVLKPKNSKKWHKLWSFLPTLPAAVSMARRKLHHSLHAHDCRNVDNTSVGHFDGFTGGLTTASSSTWCQQQQQPQPLTYYVVGHTDRVA